MKRQFLLILGWVGVLLASPCGVRAQSPLIALADSCIEVERMTVKGTSMEPLLKNGSKVWLYHDYYECGNTVQRGDIVAFHSAVEKIPLIKRVCATPLDTLSIQAGYLMVNGDTLANSAGDHYHFNEGQARMIGMYIRDGHIPDGSYLMFGDNVRVSTDSRAFGVCSAREIMGRFGAEP
jgi:signal peptidase I